MRHLLASAGNGTRSAEGELVTMGIRPEQVQFRGKRGSENQETRRGGKKGIGGSNSLPRKAKGIKEGPKKIERAFWMGAGLQPQDHQNKKKKERGRKRKKRQQKPVAWWGTGARSEYRSHGLRSRTIIEEKTTRNRSILANGKRKRGDEEKKEKTKLKKRR